MNQHSDWRLYGTLIFLPAGDPLTNPSPHHRPAHPVYHHQRKKSRHLMSERSPSERVDDGSMQDMNPSIPEGINTQKRKERINKFWNLRHLIGWRARFVPLCLSLSICIYVLEPIRLGQSCLLRRCSMVILRRFSCLLRACP